VHAGHCCPVWDVEYSPNDRAVFGSVGQDGQLRLWDERKVACATMSSMPQGSPIFCLSWSSSGKMIAAGSENGEVLFFDPRSIETPLKIWKGHDDSVRRVSMLPGYLSPRIQSTQVTRDYSRAQSTALSNLVPRIQNANRNQMHACACSVHAVKFVAQFFFLALSGLASVYCISGGRAGR
jgi:WD40 repeat protein